jgi:O-antigen/teichoic acid export membrane protein
MLKRILKMIMAQGASVGVTLLTQILLPPIFLHSYGVAQYGEWLVLSATISYLSTLNFGITTYASNELTILRQRGDLVRYRVLQASTLALTLGLIVIGAGLSAVVGILPLKAWFHLRTISQTEAGLTAFFLGLQMMTHILAGYYNNLFMVVQEAHRGTVWYNVRRVGVIVAGAVLALFHLSFAMIAFGQLAAIVLITIGTVVDLRARMRGLPIGLGGANWSTVRSTLKPSGMFGMVFMQTFLLFQVPVMLLQWLLGPEIVVLFTISRTVMATARQILSIVTNAIAPEITFSFGSGNMARLLDIFHYSERVVFFLVPVANLGTFLFSPILLRLWLHKPELFEQYTYILMALISAVMSVREHKQFFQFSTNTHHRLAHIVFWGNVLMVLVSIPATHWFGVHGLMWTWLLSETCQMALLYRENRKLFDNDPSITMGPVLRLALLMGASIFPCMWLVHFGREHSLALLAGLAIAGTAALAFASYYIFGVRLVQDRIINRIFRGNRTAPASAEARPSSPQ